MCSRVLLVCLALGLFHCIYSDFVEARSRQKRCIVIQKQSGTHGDSSEDDGDDEYRKPQPKQPKPDRLRHPYGSGNKDHDAENVSPELLKYKILPIKPRSDRLRNRLFKKYTT